MPPVTDNTDILELPSHSAEDEVIYHRAPAIPFSRSGRPALFPALRGWRMLRLRLHSHAPQTCTRRRPQEPAMSIDLLARQYPDIYRRITSWSI